MNAAVLSLVLFTFLVGMAGLLVLLWSITRNRVAWQKTGATLIFHAGGIGRVEEPAGSAADVAALAEGAHGRASATMLAPPRTSGLDTPLTSPRARPFSLFSLRPSSGS